MSASSSNVPPTERGLSRLGLWFSVLTGPIAWGIHSLAEYFLSPVACANHNELPLHLATVLLTLVTLYAGVVGWRLWRQTGYVDQSGSDGARGWKSFLAIGGVFISGMFVLIILAEGIPGLFLNVCGQFPQA